MEPKCLRPDELNYELVLRNIGTNHPDRLLLLQQALNAEALGQCEAPLDAQRITRQTVTQELRECDSKLGELVAEFDEALAAANDMALGALQSRLMHLSGRAARLQAYAPEHAAVGRIVGRISELGRTSKVGRLSLGAGESMADDDVMCPDVGDDDAGAIGGVRRRTLERQQVLPLEAPYVAAPRVSLPRAKAPSNGRFSWGLDDMTHAFADHRDAANGQLPPPNQYSLVGPGPANPPIVRRSSQFAAPPAPNSRAEAQAVHGGFRIAKWPLRFSGGANELTIDEFLFRVERLARLDGVTPGALAIGVGVLLTDRAAQWFWTYQRKGDGGSWDELKAAFIRRYRPQRENDHDIRAKIEARKQRCGESFGDFCQDIEALAVRLMRRMPDDEIVETLRRNMTMTLRKALWRTHTASIDELMQACSEFEILCEEEERQMRTAMRRQMRVSEIEAMNAEEEWAQRHAPGDEGTDDGERHVEAMQMGMSRSDRVICWNCKDLGHVFSQCPVPLQGRFCFSCGMSGVLKAECVKCAGNARRDVRMATARSMPQVQPQIMKRPPNSELQQQTQIAAIGNPFSSANAAQPQ